MSVSVRACGFYYVSISIMKNNTNIFRYILFVFTVGFLAFASTIIIMETRDQKRTIAESRGAQEILSTVQDSLEEVFADPSEFFELLKKMPALHEFKKDPARVVSDAQWHENIVKEFQNARALFPTIHGIYLIDTEGIVQAFDGDPQGDDTTFIVDSAERALILREGEITLSRFHSLTNTEANESVILYSTPIECDACEGEPQVAVLVAVLSLDTYFASITTRMDMPKTLFVINADSRYLFRESATEKAATFLPRGAGQFSSQHQKRTYFVKSLYPGLNGRVAGIPNRLNTRYLPTEQQFWVVGYYQ